MLGRRIEPDLILIDILNLALVLVILIFPVPWLRLILGFPFVLFFPGYVLVAALFLRKESLTVATRIALSLGLSMVVVIFLGLLLNYTPWGIRFHPLLLSISLFSFLMSGLSWYARGRIGSEERFRVSLHLPLANLGYSLRTAGKQYYSLIFILICVILGGSSALGYIMAKPLARQAFSEFYILGIEAKAENYPQELYTGEEGRVIVYIVNHEQKEINYRLEVMVDGKRLYEPASIPLKPEEKWEREVRFALQKIGGYQKVEFLLYKGETEPGEIRYLWVKVRA